MPNPSPIWSAHCACGRTELVCKGTPLATVACYCDDCQAAAKQIDALPSGRSGIGPDGGTVNALYRKDGVSCVRGSELLIDHKLRPNSPARREIATCCNSNMTTRFDNWLPMVAVRTHSQNLDSLRPRMCINAKYAPDASQIIHPVPRHASLPPGLLAKVFGAAAGLAFGRLGLDGSRVY